MSKELELIAEVIAADSELLWERKRFPIDEEGTLDPYPSVVQRSRREVAERVVSVLSERGYSIVQLPKPDSHGRWRSERWGVRDDGWMKWSVGTDADGILFATARRGEGDPTNMAAELRAFAAALLAATAAAEEDRQQTDVERLFQQHLDNENPDLKRHMQTAATEGGQ